MRGLAMGHYALAGEVEQDLVGWSMTIETMNKPRKMIDNLLADMEQKGEK